MAEKKKKVEATQPSAKKPLFDEKGVAASPIEAFPGEIRFPAPFDGGEYRRFTERFSYDSEQGWPQDIFQLHYYWYFAIALAEFRLEGVDTAAPFDEQDYRVLKWVSDCAKEYERRFLSYTR